MGGGTSTTTTGPADKQVGTTLDQLLKGISTAQTAGPTYTGPGATTTSGQADALKAANNPAYTQGINSAYGDVNNLLGSGGLTAGQAGDLSATNGLAAQYGAMAGKATAPSLTEQIMKGVASGADLGKKDPGYAALRSKLSNDVLTSTDSAFNNSGLFGSDTNQKSAASGLADSLGALDYQQYGDSLTRQQQALASIEGQRQTGVQNQQTDLAGKGNSLSNAFGEGQQGTSNMSALSQLLPGLFSAGQLPAGVKQAIGSAQDTSKQAAANKNITLLQNLIPMLTGGAGAAGAGGTATTSPTTPLWQSLLGILAQAV